MAVSNRPASASLEVIAGCMFSGKTERLIARLRTDEKQGQRVGGFKHTIDDRYDADHLVTHTQDRFGAIRVECAPAIVDRSGDLDTVGIDEGHFFGKSLIQVATTLLADGKRVIVAGIDHDAWGRPFTPMPELAELADRVVHTFAACRKCGGQARYSQRMVPVGTNLMVGGAEAYEPRCVKCFQPLAGDPPPVE